MHSAEFDVVILGAGLSGIGAACRLNRSMPEMSYAVLDRRTEIGGTWDLFKYPGIRSDSDMTTFGYSFKQWKSPKLLADGPAIKRYVSEAAEEHGVTPNIRFKTEIETVAWCSKAGRWSITARNLDSGEVTRYQSQLVVNGTGYYNHKRGHTPEFKGRERFQGEIVHPQFWPEQLDYQNKQVVVIGSGATAVTLVPNMAKTAAKVTMLQRSPTYVISVPEVDPVYVVLSKVLPVSWVFAMSRVRNVLLQQILYRVSNRWPKLVRRWLLGMVKSRLKNQTEMKHFEPRYNPWEQRLCAVPNGDLFKSIASGEAAVVTDTIDTFDEQGIQLQSGQHIPADIIVTATGLELLAFGGAEVKVDGKPVAINEHMLYKGMMFEGVPNLLHIQGYFNASWTLRADIVTDHFLRVIKHMKTVGADIVTAKAGSGVGVEPPRENRPNYVLRGEHTFPVDGDKKPWAALGNYLTDAVQLKLGKVTHSALEYRKLTPETTVSGDVALETK